MNERIVGLDIGDSRIGVAVSDPTRLIASPLEVIRSVGWGPDTRRVAEICAQYGTTEVLSGLPLNMNGTEGFQAQKVRNFCAQLEKLGLKVYYQDERLTTVTAEEALLEADLSREDRRRVVDKVAAAVILQQWLDEQREKAKSEEDNAMTDDFNNETFEGGEYDPDELDVIELVDDEGNTLSFQLADRIEHEGTDYLYLIPDSEDEDSDEPQEVVIMKVIPGEDEEETYEGIEDDDLLDTLFQLFLESNGDVEFED